MEHFYIDSEQFLYLFELKNAGAIPGQAIQQELLNLVSQKNKASLSVKQWL